MPVTTTPTLARATGAVRTASNGQTAALTRASAAVRSSSASPTASTVKTTAAIRSASSAPIASVGRVIGAIRASSSGQTATLVRAIAAIRAAAAGQTATATRTTATTRTTSATPTATLARLTSHTLTAAATTVAAKLAGKAWAITLATTQQAGHRSLSQLLSATQGQTATLAASKVRLLTVAATQPVSAVLARMIGKAVTISSGGGWGDDWGGDWGGQGQTVTAALSRALAVQRKASQPQTATLGRLSAFHTILTALQGQQASLRRSTAHAFSAPATSVASLRRASLLTRSAAQPQTATLAKQGSLKRTLTAATAPLASLVNRLFSIPSGAFAALTDRPETAATMHETDRTRATLTDKG